jgi:hypothetical protein
MLTVILLVMGVIVVAGAVYMAMFQGAAGGRHAQSGRSIVIGQRQEKLRVNSARASGGDD